MKRNKASTHINVITYTEQERFEENINDILVREENSYLGWTCWSGIQSLCINADGDVFNASCSTHKLGNIHTGFDLPTEPLICIKKWCVCAADLNLTKIKNENYRKYVRAGKKNEGKS